MPKVLLLLAMAAALTSCSRKKEAPAPAPSPKAVAAPPAAAGVMELGKRMPAYTAKRLDGSPFDLAAERGNVVLLNLWATWCGPCRFEIPELQRMHDKFASQRFKVVGVSVDEGSPDEVRRFVAEQKMTYPVVLDPDGKLATVFQTTVLPTSAILDRNGIVVWKSAGIIMPNDAAMMQALTAALAK